MALITEFTSIAGMFLGVVDHFKKGGKDALRRKADGTFAAAEILKDRHGKPLNVGSASAAFAVDWDASGTVDLLVGNILGEVYFIPNEGKGKDLDIFKTLLRVFGQGFHDHLFDGRWDIWYFFT